MTINEVLSCGEKKTISKGTITSSKPAKADICTARIKCILLKRDCGLPNLKK